MSDICFCFCRHSALQKIQLQPAKLFNRQKSEIKKFISSGKNFAFDEESKAKDNQFDESDEISNEYINYSREDSTSCENVV